MKIKIKLFRRMKLNKYRKTKKKKNSNNNRINFKFHQISNNK